MAKAHETKPSASRAHAEAILATIDDIISGGATDDQYVAGTMRVAEYIDRMAPAPKQAKRSPCYWSELGLRWKTSHENFMPAVKLGPYCPECGRKIEVLNDEI